MKQIILGFRDFISKGNAIDLAVGVVIGTAFTQLVTALVSSLVLPLVSAIFGKPNFDEVGNFAINGAEFSVGTVLTAIVNFVLVALALYLAIVLPINKLREYRERRAQAGLPVELADDRTELDVLKQIQESLAARDGSAH